MVRAYVAESSMATARFMETWAHARDIYDALGLEPAPDDRVRHVAHIGARTRDFAYGVRPAGRPRRSSASS